LHLHFIEQMVMGNDIKIMLLWEHKITHEHMSSTITAIKLFYVSLLQLYIKSTYNTSYFTTKLTLKRTLICLWNLK